MKYSVIIPTYNRERTIVRCLESLCHQTLKDFEVVVVDDGSQDSTSEIVHQFHTKLKLKYIKRDTPSGGAAIPRNLAAQNATGEWLCFLDSDDFWYPEKLNRIDFYTDQSDIIYHDLDTYNVNGKLNKSQNCRTLVSPIFIDLMVKHNALVTSGTSVRRSLFNQVKGFENIELEDYDLWLRLAKITERFTHLKECLGGYYLGLDNTTQVSEKEILRLQKIFNKHSTDLSKPQQQDALCALHYIQGRIYKKMGNKQKAKECFIDATKSKVTQIKIKAFINRLLV